MEEKRTAERRITKRRIMDKNVNERRKEMLKEYITKRLTDNSNCKIYAIEIYNECFGLNYTNVSIINKGVRGHIGRAMKQFGWQRRQCNTRADRRTRGVYYNPPLHWEVSAWERGA